MNNHERNPLNLSESLQFDSDTEKILLVLKSISFSSFCTSRYAKRNENSLSRASEETSIKTFSTNTCVPENDFSVRRRSRDLTTSQMLSRDAIRSRNSKTSQVFSVHIMLKKLLKATLTGHFEFVFSWGKLGQEITCLSWYHHCRKSPLSKCFPSTVIRKFKSRAFSNSSSLKSVFEKLLCPDGLLWMVVLIVDIKLLFQIPVKKICYNPGGGGTPRKIGWGCEASYIQTLTKLVRLERKIRNPIYDLTLESKACFRPALKLVP